MMIFDANDPRLTAFALDEIDPAARSEIEQLLADCEEARNHVAEIRQTAQWLAAELQKEPEIASTLAMTNHRLVDQALKSAVSCRERPPLVAQALPAHVDGRHAADGRNGRIGLLECLPGQSQGAEASPKPP